ncbi:MAG: sigma-54-dependent transcriptional regulator [Planctomycetota bacterium]|jgi:two-component system NtrC family response regulator/two-component system response regulator HydG
MALILIIEDEASARTALVKALEKGGHDVLAASSAESALPLLREHDPAVVLSDVVMSGMDGIELLERVVRMRPGAVVVMMTAFGTVERAVKAMKLGAFDFLEKPLDLDDLRRTVERALAHHALLAENQRLKAQLKERYRFRNIIGSSEKMQGVFDVITQVAPSRATVLILGESGTGKELIANAIHYESPRADAPFIKVNCAALPENLLESELFGHEKGAFTGAVAQRKGRFEMADGGTIFLDEIGDLPQPLQVKLLRVLQEREFERVGGSETLKVDVRVVAATNVDVDSALAEGTIREDLYYRLKVITIEVPPLRDRPGDIPPLAHHFLEKYAEENGKAGLELHPDVLRAFDAYGWPGNVRELENALETAVVLARESTLTTDLFPFAPKALVAANEPQVEDGRLLIRVGTPMEEVEKKLILATLESVGGNKTEAAKVLGIGTRTLYRRLAEYGADADEPGDQ